MYLPRLPAASITSSPVASAGERRAELFDRRLERTLRSAGDAAAGEGGDALQEIRQARRGLEEAFARISASAPERWRHAVARIAGGDLSSEALRRLNAALVADPACERGLPPALAASHLENRGRLPVSPARQLPERVLYAAVSAGLDLAKAWVQEVERQSRR